MFVSVKQESQRVKTFILTKTIIMKILCKNNTMKAVLVILTLCVFSIVDAQNCVDLGETSETATMEVTFYKMKGQKAMDAAADFAVRRVIFDGVANSENHSEPVIANPTAMSEEQVKELDYLLKTQLPSLVSYAKEVRKDKKMKASVIMVVVNVKNIKRQLQNYGIRRKFGVD